MPNTSESRCVLPPSITADMENPARRSGRFRHVVFADAIDGADRALNLAPTELIENDRSIDADDGAFLQWLFQLGGLDVRQYRNETLARRLPACLRKLRVTTIGQARATLQRDPQALHDALSSMLIGVTAFFRDGKIFDDLAERLLPELLQHKRPLRVWSVGCSDGPELYSIAMLLAELGVHEGVELLGTDCRVHATRAALRGSYDRSAVRGICSERLALHFDYLPALADASAIRSPAERSPTERSPRWQVKDPLRTMTRWRTADILKTIEPGPWDLILCRNTAMYLRPSAAAVLWDQLASALARGGYLVLGKAERPPVMLGITAIGQHVYRRSN